jgi:uncharacterized secreted protein with C-terminal beta-propeller domain
MACGSRGGGNTPPEPTSAEEVFESAHPSGARGGDGWAVEDDGIAAPNAPVGAAPPSGADNSNGDGVGRAIDEADIIKRDGDRLYALSTLGGLAIVDLSDPTALELLGRFRSTATPFEMYVRGDTVFVLYNGYVEYAYDEETERYTVYQTSYVIALDVTDPAAITERQRFEVQGYIADSRLVGDALYVVAFDDSYCYACGNTPQTRVVSFNVSSPDDVVQVDELTFAERESTVGWGRSLSGNDHRLYVSGPQYSNDGSPTGSVIRVIDITDRSGDMEEGAALAVAGQVNSRWQMDEYEGVLRVVSQPLSWRVDTVPRVETFEVVSAEELNPLGAVNLVLPEPETLRSVRFDGTRGYAITFRETDPLFTLDLSDPANPVQAGELEMPGWVFHMEPRGDRVVGLGYDQGNHDGALTVSLFDVSDFAKPTMIDRVNFGGNWGYFAEDQDRIHKSFQVLDDEGLILVPFTGSAIEGQCPIRYLELSGVQLVGFAEDRLSLAGVASTKGYARRGFIHEGRLLAMSDQRLEAFDISNRAEPMSISKLDLSRSVDSVAVAGAAIIQVGTEDGREVEATVSTLNELVAFAPGKTLTVSHESDCEQESHVREVITSDDRGYVVFNSYSYTDKRGGFSNVTTLDVSNPDEPKVIGSFDLDVLMDNSDYGRAPGLVTTGATALAFGDALAFGSHRVEYDNRRRMTMNEASLEILDLRDPEKPEQTSLALPRALGYTGLSKSGNIIATSHFVTASEDGQSVRFYLDRIDVSDVSAPVLSSSLNVPGSLLTYEHESQRAVLLDYQYVRLSDTSPMRCYEEEFGTYEGGGWVDYENDRGNCTAIRFRVNVVDVSGKRARILESVDLDRGVSITSVAAGDDRVFLGTGAPYQYYYGYDDLPRPPSGGIGWAVDIGPGGYWYYPVEERETPLLVVSGTKDGEVTIATLDVATTSQFTGFGHIVASGKKAVVAAGWQNRMSVIDASDPAAPVEAETIELAGNVRDMTLMGDTAILALGEAGVHTVRLSSGD